MVVFQSFQCVFIIFLHERNWSWFELFFSPFTLTSEHQARENEIVKFNLGLTAACSIRGLYGVNVN
jgi:hypothetical protein